MHSFSGRKLRVAIVGGGIGGLTCAAALKDCDSIELDLFEAAAKFIAIGAGIVTWPRTWSVFEALGLNEEMLERIKKMDPCEEVFPAWEFRLSDSRRGRKIHELYYTDATPTNLHRQQLLDLLLEHLPFHCQVHFGHRLVSCREYEDRRGCGVELHFRNGVTLDGYDLVIGADGLKSVVRQTVIAQSRGWTGLDASVKDLGFSPSMTNEEHCHLGRRHDILYTGQSAFRGLVPREKIAALYPDHRALRTSTIYCGKSKHVVVYPISNGEIVNVVAFFSDSQSGSPVILETTGSSSPQNNQVPTDAVVNMYPGWEDEVVDLLKMLETPTIWPILDLNPLETYATSRIALLGDASHSMSPHLGAGACTAIEDAYILGSLISRSKLNTIIDIKPVLAVYNTLRQPYGNEIMRWAREMGEFYEFDSQDIQVDEVVDSLVNEATEEQMSKFRKGTEKYWSWPVRAAGTIGEDLRRGQEMLNEAKLGAL
ncbi:hypothetical protein F5890DRAFT_758582 [Lentinula detonsa]|uniref:FAD-binding domain-containing protein n=1 Tax=Lentinula detonsa TaxID=2804962 RepID=A0AA38UMT8_9AGAR|nr:hypothetical protein F5890DRAFT_758582 [Lentinula detonsa]